MIDKKIQEKIYNDKDLKVFSKKCENCGGETVFDPKEQKLKCLYCGSVFNIEINSKIEERNLDELLKNGQVWESAEVLQCQSCGAKEIIEAGEVSHVCPFCGTNSIVKISEIPGLKPQGVVPFRLEKSKAILLAIKWAKKKLYAPKKFKKSVKTENLHGVYSPIFTFDAQSSSTYMGCLGKSYVVTTYRNGKTYVSTRVRYFNISGSVDMNFDDIVVQASTDFPQNVIKSLEPFPTKDVPSYDPKYLKGFSANTYNKEGAKCWEESVAMMNHKIEQNILKKYDYDYKQSLSVNTTFSSKTYKYILVPIYVGHFSYNKKLYNFYINGDNGKIAGKTPVSVWKVLFTIFGLLLGLTGIILLFYLT